MSESHQGNNSHHEKREEIKPGFYQITRVCHSPTNATTGTATSSSHNMMKHVSFLNATTDTQFNIAIEFRDPQLEPLGEAGQVAIDQSGKKYAMSVYPGERKDFVRGSYTASRRSLSFGTPDKKWRDAQALVINESVGIEIETVRELLKYNTNNSRDRGTSKVYTAEIIAKSCEEANVPFVDLTFLPGSSSCCRDFEGRPPTYAWMRPATYCKEKKTSLYVGAIEPNDIDQGNLGDCYFMCAIACVSEFPELIKKIFSFAPQCPELGIYRALMCKNGWWQLCTVDDLLPINPATLVPIYGKNREEPHELWVSILEKVYAKLHGSFAAIRSGDPAMAMHDTTGFPYTRMTALPEWEDKDALFEYLLAADARGDLMTLGTPGVDTTTPQDDTTTTSSPHNKNDDDDGAGVKIDDLATRYKQVGLCSGHAFSLIKVVRTTVGNHRLCMIRNPWGGQDEWNGAWSDSDSSRWTEELKKEVGFSAAEDGTFWMEWNDVCKWYDSGSVTHVLSRSPQCRVAGNLENGIPDIVPVIYNNHKHESVELWFGAHQKDKRGVLPSAKQKDGKYVAFLVTVLHADSDDDDDGDDDDKEESDDKNSSENSPTTSKKKKKSLRKIATSGGGQFMTARDVFGHAELPPSSNPYYILVQSYHDDDTSFTCSLFLSNTDDGRTKTDPGTTAIVTNSTKIQFLSYNRISDRKKYNPATRFAPQSCTKRVPAKYQIYVPPPSLSSSSSVAGPSASHPSHPNFRIVEKTGDSVSWSVVPPSLQSKPTSPDTFSSSADKGMVLSGRRDTTPLVPPPPPPRGPQGPHAETQSATTKQPSVQSERKEEEGGTIIISNQDAPQDAPSMPKHVDPILTKDDSSPLHTVKQRVLSTFRDPFKKKKKEWIKSLMVIILNGVDLVARDRNGLSDPFVTLTLKRSEDGTHDDEPFSTRYISETLNPVWGESTCYENVCPSSDHLLVECWDKDLFGKDAMGSCLVNIAFLSLDGGGGGQGVLHDCVLSGDNVNSGIIKLLFVAK